MPAAGEIGVRQNRTSAHRRLDSLQVAPDTPGPVHVPSTEECIERALPKVEELLRVARGKSFFIAQTHDFPDPDTIASSLGLVWLLREKLGIEGIVGYGGIVGRAENRAMVKVLGIKLKRTTNSDFKNADLLALLDTQPEVGNHSLPKDRMPDIVVDHHFERELEGEKPVYFDVGGDVGTTSTKVTELVRAAGLTPPPEVATALFYGLKSDTRDLARLTRPADVASYLYLFPLMDPALLNEIENPQVPMEYFRILNKAIQRGKIYGHTIVADLGPVYTPDLCAEIADRLLQIEGIKHAVATGWFEDSLFFSLRTRTRNRNLGKIIHGIVAKSGLGGAGGHGQMAGARIPMGDRTPRSRGTLRRKVLGEILTAFGEDPKTSHRMIAAEASESPKNGKRPHGRSRAANA